MANGTPDTAEIVRRALESLYCGDGIAGQITADFVHYRNVGEMTMDAATALADHAGMRDAIGSASVTFARTLKTAQGVVCEPRIEGLTIRGDPFVLLPMMYIQIDGAGMIYRIDEYFDSAGLVPLAGAGYAPAV